MPASTKALMLKPDGTMVPSTFFADNAAALNAAVDGGDGGSGADGREVELQSNGTYLQWRYVGEESWTNLVALSALTGPQGNAGANGSNGKTWRSGAGVPDNSLGTDGDFYLRTSNGDVYWRDSGAYGVVTNLKGGTGAAGATWRTGSGAPDNGVGVNDDLYLDTATGNVYQRSAGTYSVIANIKGADGGAGMVWASASLNGHTNPGTVGGGAFGWAEIGGSWTPANTGTITIIVNGGAPTVFTVATSNPFDGTNWVDSDTYNNPALLVTGLSLAFDGVLSGLLDVAEADPQVTVTTLSSGYAFTVEVTSTVTNITGSGLTHGTDDSPPSGEVLLADLVIGQVDKKIRVLRAWLVGDLDALVRLTDGVDPLSADFTPTSFAELQPDAATLAAWMSGSGSGRPLQAQVVGDPAPNTGLSATVHVIAILTPA